MSNHPNRSKINNWPKYLKAFRKEYNLTQKRLADRLQISSRTVENWEMGINPPPPYLEKALRQLECELNG